MGIPVRHLHGDVHEHLAVQSGRGGAQHVGGVQQMGDRLVFQTPRVCSRSRRAARSARPADGPNRPRSAGRIRQRMKRDSGFCCGDFGTVLARLSIAAFKPLNIIERHGQRGVAWMIAALCSGRRDFVSESREKGSGAFCAQHSSGRSGKMHLTPFPGRQVQSHWERLKWTYHVDARNADNH